MIFWSKFCSQTMRRCSTITNAWLFLLCFHFLKAAKKFCCLELDSSKIQRSRPLKSSTAMEGWLINSLLSTDTFQLCVKADALFFFFFVRSAFPRWRKGTLLHSFSFSSILFPFFCSKILFKAPSTSSKSLFSLFSGANYCLLELQRFVYFWWSSNSLFFSLF